MDRNIRCVLCPDFTDIPQLSESRRDVGGSGRGFTGAVFRFYPLSGGFDIRGGWVGWFELFYIGLGIACVWLLSVHFREPLAFIPTSWLGKGQLLFLVFIWWVVIFNFERALVGFSPHRLVTEGVITLNAIICYRTESHSVHRWYRKQTGSLFIFNDWVLQTLVWGIVTLVGTTVVFLGDEAPTFRKGTCSRCVTAYSFRTRFQCPEGKTEGRRTASLVTFNIVRTYAK